MYTVGYSYTCNDIYDLLGISDDKRGGDWQNGYHRHESDYYVFCNVGIAGRTGHDYDNHWEGERLVWYGKTKSHFAQSTIQNLVSGGHGVLVFYRDENRAPFTFAGIGTAIPHHSIEQPVRIDWVFGADDSDQTSVFTDEHASTLTFTEGRRTQVYVNRYERDRRARDACIRHHGTKCGVCHFDFEETYGELGKGFIHVHHITPVSDWGGDYAVDPINDLVPVCPNCHAMLHRRNPPLTVMEMQIAR